MFGGTILPDLLSRSRFLYERFVKPGFQVSSTTSAKIVQVNNSCNVDPIRKYILAEWKKFMRMPVDKMLR